MPSPTPAAFLGRHPAARQRRGPSHRALPRAPWFSPTQLWLLGLITLLGAVLRLYELETWSLWIDEAHTWRDATTPLFGDRGFFGSYRSNYPLSYLLLRGLLSCGLLVGQGEGWLRLPFAFCGIVTVPLLALVGNLFVGRGAALFAALLLAVNPWHLYWSQNARGYVFAAFFVVLAAGAFWVAWQGRRRWWWLAAVVGAAIGGLFHATAFLVLPVFVVTPLLERLPAAAQGRMLRLGLLLTAVVVLVPILVRSLPWFQDFLAAKSSTSLLHYLQTTAFYYRVPLLCMGAVGALVLLRDAHAARGRLLVCWAALPLLLLGVLGATVVKTTARYGFVALPALLLLAATGVVRIAQACRAAWASDRGRRWWIPAGLLPLILLVDSASYDYLYYTTQCGDRGRWRQVRDYVLATTRGRPFTVLSVNEPSLQYYLRPNHWRDLDAADPHPGIEVQAIVPWEVADGQDYFAARVQLARQQDRELFVVVTRPELAELDRDGSLQRALAADFVLATVLPCQVGPKDETIYIYRPLPSRQ